MAVFLGEGFEALEVGDFFFELGDEDWANVLGPALHAVGVAELVEAAAFSFGVMVLSGEGAWSHGAEVLELGFDLFDLALEMGDFA
jgi:hypothetical protein